MIKEHNQLVVVVMGLLDLAVTAAAWFVCLYLRFQTGWFSFAENAPPGLRYGYSTLAVTMLLTMLIFGWMGLYHPRRIQSLGSECWDIARACALAWVLEVAISHFLHKPRVSIMLQATFLAVWPAMLIAYRGSARMIMRALRRRGRNLRTVAIVGSGRLGQKLLHMLRRQKWIGYQIAYFVEDQRIGQDFLGVPVRGPIDAIDRILAEKPVDAVFIALPQDRSQSLSQVLARLALEAVNVYFVPDLLSYQFLRHQVQQVGPLSVVALTDSPQAGFRGVLKRLMDITGASVLLVALSPLLLALALAVKLGSKGPVFYRQRRASLGGRPFIMFKFRSMVVDAETHGQPVWGATANDPRVTALGRLMRKLSLDELPQLLNVLAGDMSLVGPRPERPEFVQRFVSQVPGYALRHHVKAGLTGWAQVKGYRGRTSLRKRIQYDLDYINRWSLGLDLWILLLTAMAGFVNPKD